jgi:hypothetical protein
MGQDIDGFLEALLAVLSIFAVWEVVVDQERRFELGLISEGFDDFEEIDELSFESGVPGEEGLDEVLEFEFDGGVWDCVVFLWVLG